MPHTARNSPHRTHVGLSPRKRQRWKLAAIFSLGLFGPSQRDIYYFCLQLRSLLSAGFPIINALAVLEENSRNWRLKQACRAMARACAKGASFEQAVAKQSIFSPFFAKSIVVGEKSGSLISVLDILARHHLWAVELRRAVFSVIWYPTVVLFLGLFICAVRDIIIRSILNKAFEMYSAAFVFGLYFKGVLFILLFTFVLAQLLREPKTKVLVDRVVLKIPLWGHLMHNYAVAQFFRMFAITLDSGMNLTTAYRTAAESSNNKAIEKALLKREYFLSAGETIHDTLALTGVIKPEALGMIRAGEYSGSASELMNRQANWYEQDIRTTIPALVRMAFPFYLILVAIGFFLNPAFIYGTLFILLLLFFIVR
jgi:type IV pilus assembly protein PilC